MKIKNLTILLFIIFINACSEKSLEPQLIAVPIAPEQKISSVPIYPKQPVKTTPSVESFSLETPYRCDVSWDDQKLISSVPGDINLLKLERTDKGDELPALKVNKLSFEDLTVDDIFKLLLAGTGIELYAPDPPYQQITTKEVDGKLSDVIELIASSANLYYSYDAKIKRLTLKRQASWQLHIPASDEVIIAILDALRGADMSNIITDWQERTINFKGNKFVEDNVRNLIKEIASENVLIAFDMDVYRIYPYAEDGINWMELLKSFKKGSVKVSVNGIIGRLLVTDSNINTKTLAKFMQTRSNYVLISRGTFILPNRWQGRFDIGQCSRDNRLETPLQILAEPSFKKTDYNKINTDIILRLSNGDISTYNAPLRAGNNMLIIGIPTHYFVSSKETIIPPNAELMMFISPRFIKIVK